MYADREDFFSDYDVAELDREQSVELTHRDLLLIRVAVGTFLRETSRKDHVYRDLHRLLSKLPAPIDRHAAAPKGGLLHEVTSPDAGPRR